MTTALEHHQQAQRLQAHAVAHANAMISALCVRDWEGAELARARATATFEAFLDAITAAHRLDAESD